MSTSSKVGHVILWLGVAAAAAYVIIGWVIPFFVGLVNMAGSNSGRGTLIFIGIWLVCGVIAWFIAGAFTDSTFWKIVVLLLGAVALGVFILRLMFMFVPGRRE